MLATQKLIKRQGWWKGKFALFWMLVTGGEGRADTCPKANSPTTDNQGARAFIDGGRWLHVKTAQSALTVILKLVIGGLTSIILIVLRRVSLQFQGQFVPIPLRPVLGTVVAYVMATVWSSRYLLPPGGGFSIYKRAHRIQLRILSMALEKELNVLEFV